MENFNSDPKPGRLILPLVLIGMIATTYTFINRVATQNDLEISQLKKRRLKILKNLQLLQQQPQQFLKM